MNVSTQLSPDSFKTSNERDSLLQSLKDMLEIRVFEEIVSKLYSRKLIRGFCHLCIGQEAIPVAIKNCFQQGDGAITSYRAHGLFLALGGEPLAGMSELLGRSNGCSKGKGGSMHMFDFPHGFYGGHGIVGAQIPLGCGLAFAMKYDNTNNICFTLLGDGAVNQGQFYESMNMAQIWKLPVLFMIENNTYAIGTQINRSTSNHERLHERGLPFGIPGKKVDGMNFLETLAALQEAVTFIRQGGGPMLLELDTRRFRGHSMSDSASYRTKEQLEQDKARDPIISLKEILATKYHFAEEDYEKLEEVIREKMKKIEEAALKSPFPDEKVLFNDICA